MSDRKRLKIPAMIIIGSLAVLFPAADNAGTPSWQVIVMRLDDYRSFLEVYPPLDRLACSGDNGCFLVTGGELDQVRALSLPFRVQEPALPGAYPATGGLNGVYHDYRESEAFLRDLAARFPGQARLESIGRSWEGREVYALKISDNADMEEAEPNIVILGCHHAREWISVEVPLRFAEYLLVNQGSDPQARAAVTGAQVYILPLVNPDGLEFSIRHYRLWRKNRRYNGYYTWGVDLNRNYDYQWGYDNQGSSPNPASAAYRGPDPFSEPESQAVRDFLLAHPPAGTVSYHNFSRLIIYPWGFKAEPAPDDAEMRAVAAEMSRQIFQVNGRLYNYGPGGSSLYLTNGDLDDWVYATFQVPAFTIELPPVDYFSGGFFTSETEIGLSFSENLPALLYFVQYGIDQWSGQAPLKDLPGKTEDDRQTSKRR
jgi:hypothetical protein